MSVGIQGRSDLVKQIEREWCCCGGYNASNVKKNKHYYTVVRRTEYEIFC